MLDSTMLDDVASTCCIRFAGPLAVFRIHLFSRVDIYFLYRVDYTFGLPDCVRYNEDFVISRFCSIHFTCNFCRAEEYRSLYPRTS